METWVILFTLAQFIWVAGVFIDKYLLVTSHEETGDESSESLVLVSAFFNIIVAAVIFLGLIVFQGFENALAIISIDSTIIVLAVVVGVIEILYLIPYFAALHESDEISAPPLFQTIPVFGFLLGFFVFNEVPTLVQIGGGAIILLGSVLLNLELMKSGAKENALKELQVRCEKEGRKEPSEKEIQEAIAYAEKHAGDALNTKALALMLFASFILALSAFLFKDAAEQVSFWGVTFWMSVGSVSFGLFLLFIPKYRKQFREMVQGKGGNLKLQAGNETLDNVATVLGYGAVVTGPSVGAVLFMTAYQPVYLLLVGFILARIGSGRHQNLFNRGSRHIIRKVLAILFVVTGSLLLF